MVLPLFFASFAEGPEGSIEILRKKARRVGMLGLGLDVSDFVQTPGETKFRLGHLPATGMARASCCHCRCHSWRAGPRSHWAQSPVAASRSVMLCFWAYCQIQAGVAAYKQGNCVTSVETSSEIWMRLQAIRPRTLESDSGRADAISTSTVNASEGQAATQSPQPSQKSSSKSNPSACIRHALLGHD